MKNIPEPFRSVKVTLISHSDCGTCSELLKELEPIRQKPHIAFEVVNVLYEEPPSYAQAFIIPATYVDRTLWRYGKYCLPELEERLHRKPNETIKD